MTTKEKFDLITRNTEEILTPEDLRTYLDRGYRQKHYIGFEISGKIHLGTGLSTMLKIKDFMEAGVECHVFLADWHTWINNKLGGDLKVIKKIAVSYFKEGLKASMKCVGGDPEKINFLLGSDLYHNNDNYWQTMVEISQNINLARVLRSLDILGREEGEGIDFAKLIYPPMQVADIFIQDLTITHAGTDQRKAHVIMREVADKISLNPVKRDGKIIKPVAVHHHLILGLGKPPKWPLSEDNIRDILIDLKMSKSKPSSAIFIHDDPSEIKEKIQNAFCPPKETKFNPITDWTKHLIFAILDELKVKRDKKFGGNKTYKSYQEVETEYKAGVLHPQDLKRSVAEALIIILEPARKHFAEGEPKQALKELEKLKVTR